MPSPLGVHTGGGAQPTTPDLTRRESGAGTAHGGPALWEGVSWLPGSSRPWAGAVKSAGNGIWGDRSSASHERSRRDRARVFNESWGVLFKIRVKHAGTERALQAFVRGQASTSTEASVCGGLQLTPDTGLTRAGLHRGWGPSWGSRGWAWPDSSAILGEPALQSGSWRSVHTAPSQTEGRARPLGLGAGGHSSRGRKLARVSLSPPLSTDPHLPSSLGGHWAGPGVKGTQMSAVGIHQHFDRHNP